MEFTGTYNKCENCERIYDFNDICPDCGSDDVYDISVEEIREHIEKLEVQASDLEIMLQSHDD
jgi:tetrahydromethanopterin S-methyltransferase subunit B